MAAAGVRQDLLPLMRIPDMDAGKARALYKAGLRDAQMLATADEQAVARALAPAIAQQMRGRSSMGKLQQQRGSGMTAAAAATSYAAAGMAARAAATLVRCARDHLRQQMQDLAALATDIREDEEAAAAEKRTLQQGQPAAAVMRGGPAVLEADRGLDVAMHSARGQAAADGGDDFSPDDLAHIARQVAQVAGLGAALAGSPDQAPLPEVSIAPAAQLVWAHGAIRVTEMRARSSAAQLRDFFAIWAAQQQFALALHTLSDEELAAAAAVAGSKQRSGGAGAGAPLQRLQGLAVCWGTQEAVYLELSGAQQRARSGALLPRAWARTLLTTCGFPVAF